MVTVTVTNPQTETEGSGRKKQQFTSYLVTTVSSTTGKKQEIRRRYSDFTWLYSRLQTEIPGAVVPIIPHEYAVMDSKKRLSEEFVERRRRDLQDFLAAVCAHVELSRAPSMTPFMLDKIGVEFKEGKKRIEEEFPTHVIVEDDHSAAPPSAISNMMARIRTLTSSKEHLKTTPEEADIQLIKDYISKLDSHVRPLVKSAETMTKLTGELAVTVGDMAQPIDDWRKTYHEKQLTQDQRASQNQNKACYTPAAKTKVLDMMSAIEEFSQDYSTLLLMKHKQEEESFERSMHALLNLIRAFQLALKQRKHWQVNFTATFQQVIDKEAAIAKATKQLKPPEITGKLQDEKAVLDRKKTKELDKLKETSARIVKEFEQYQPKLELSLKTAICDYANLQRSYTDRINDAWGQLLPFVQEDEEEEDKKNKATENGDTANGDDDALGGAIVKDDPTSAFSKDNDDDSNNTAENATAPPMPSAAPPPPPSEESSQEGPPPMPSAPPPPPPTDDAKDGEGGPPPMPSAPPPPPPADENEQGDVI